MQKKGQPLRKIRLRNNTITIYYLKMFIVLLQLYSVLVVESKKIGYGKDTSAYQYQIILARFC